MSAPLSDWVTADIFECAADMVFERGLHKGGYAPENQSAFVGPRCAAGYIREATRIITSEDAWAFGRGWFGPAKRFRELANIPPKYRTGDGKINPIYSIAQWSDAVDRTAEDVREALLLAAKDLRNG